MSAATTSEPADAEDLLDGLGKPYEPLRERFGRCHAELLQSVGGAVQLRLLAEPCGGSRWTLSVCAIDCVGMLAVVAGLFAARRIDVRQGDVFSVHRDSADASAPDGDRVLDVFEVVTAEPVDAGFWTGIETELAELIAHLAAGEVQAAIERVALGVSESALAARSDDEPLFPVSVAVDNDASEIATELRIQSRDTQAFLFEFANALTLLDVNIERVEIRTLYGEARDTFWVTGTDGKSIDDPQRIQELRVATALIKQFSHLLPRSANPAQAVRQFSRFTSDVLQRQDWTATLEPLGSGDVLRTLAEMMGVSRFLWEDFLRLQHENLFPVLADVPGLEIAKSRGELEAEFAAELADAVDEPPAQALNRWKDREMFRIDLRHVTHRIGLDEFSRELTSLAEAIIAEAATLSWAQARERHVPFDKPWGILGAGKLGGSELGFASDIELIFVCDPADDAEAKFRFESFARLFLKTLEARQNGVFEIDLRLRPFGEGGPLACTEETFRSYYTAGGSAQQFERLSLVKLRSIAGDAALGRRIEGLRDAFVYGGAPLDLADIRHLRERQAAEIVRAGTTHAKYSPGGLVDIEYFVQARQIAVGGEHPEVRVPNTLEAIERLAAVKSLPPHFAGSLTEAYVFLRRLIDGLRVVRGNAKDLAIPAADSQGFDYLARRLDFASPTSLTRELESHMGFARELWS